METREPLFSRFSLPEFFDDEELRKILSEIYSRRFEELDDEGGSDLLDSIQTVNESLFVRFGKKPLVYMAMILCQCVEENIRWYLKDDIICGRVISALQEFMRGDTNKPHKVPLYSNVGVTGSQALDEAMLVINSAAELLISNAAVEQWSEAVETVVVGYAIGPINSRDVPRKLFNWWLCEVVPCSVCMVEPTVVYTLTKGVES